MNSTPLSLLERLRDEPDEPSWERLVKLYSPLVRRWLGTWDLPAADADDLLQEVLAVVVRELPQFDHSQRRGAFRSWLRSITVNRLRTYWRNRRQGQDVTDRLDQLEDPASGLSRLWDQEHDEHVARRLLELIEPEFSANTWRSFRRQVIDGLPASEVASEAGVSVNAVLIAKSRVLRRLRQEGKGLID